MAEKFEIDGMKEVIEALKALKPKVLLQIIRAVNRKDLSKNLTKQLRSALPYSSRSKRAISVVSDRSNPTGVFGGATSKAFWLRFVEFGTRQRKRKSGASLGSIKARPVIEPEIEKQTPSIIEFFRKDFGTEVDNIIVKRLKNYKKG